MKKMILFGMMLSFTLGTAQVTMEKNKLVKDGQTYKLKEFRSVFKDPNAASTFHKARTNAAVSNVFGYAGGFLIGFGIVPALSGKKTEVRNGVVYENKPSRGWAVVGIGAGLVGVGIPFAYAADKQAKKALALENGEPTAFRPHFKLESAGTGVALSYNF
ncbi:hypothetical protein [Chryseobacterium sp.]|uniref:hypothetical protein n=1 Tax=Chryseobacterium sp. TaxID=1871047 RepID=UPI0012A7EB25|nr:hypothetical protein [Chryseobacterium sp.]QFG52099.1 hypothetical protein F7R58_00450 [Chryseobacterium sp.]